VPSNFRLTIDGLDCTKVSKIDAFTIKQTTVTDDIGDARDYLKEPGKIEFPNLKITLPEASSESWLRWYEDFVIRGNNSDDKEKSGRLVFLDSTRTTELAEIRFFNLGIRALRADPPDPDNQPVGGVGTSPLVPSAQAELYCERMEFRYLGN
jgi:hypothetical protein